MVVVQFDRADFDQGKYTVMFSTGNIGQVRGFCVNLPKCKKKKKPPKPTWIYRKYLPNRTIKIFNEILDWTVMMVFLYRYEFNFNYEWKQYVLKIIFHFLRIVILFLFWCQSEYVTGTSDVARNWLGGARV